jgi:phosphatidylinositol 4-kinase
VKRNGGGAAVARHSPAALAAAAEAGLIPVNPVTGQPSERHFEAMAAKRKIGFLDLDRPASVDGGTSVDYPHPHHSSETQQFDKTPQFLDALIFLADSLFQIPREERKERLRQQLRILECELLPSNAVYVPVGNVHHRVWRVVADESIPISTKERVPCIVALEVVDFTPKRRRPKGPTWPLLDRLPGSPDSPRETVVEEAVESEHEMIRKWRYQRRNPLRRTSLLDKMTTTVKAPFDKMKTQVQEHLQQMRERGSSEELQHLSLADYLMDSSDLRGVVESGRHGETNSLSDAENGVSGVGAGLRQESFTDESSKPALSRASSASSLVSLGQWGDAPTSLRQTVSAGSPIETDITQQKKSLSQIRKRLSTETDDKKRSSPLLYGSDHEDDPKQVHAVAPSKPPLAPTKDSSTQIKARPPPVVFRESWETKQERVRRKSAFGKHPGWRLLPILIKANDDLRQEQLASQLIYRMASILARESVPVWLCPYEILALTDRGGIIEAIPDTISLDSLKRNCPNHPSLRHFFHSHFGEGTEELAGAKANFVESLAAYSMVCFLLQIKDRHNGNILIDNLGHVVHIDFGFFFLSSPGKNVGFESAPFKLTREFVEVLDGPESHLFRSFRDLCVRTFIALRRRCMEIILLVEMLKNGNEELPCFRGRPDDAIQQLRERFRLDLNDRACKEYVNSLIDDSIENWRTDWYDRYQRYFVGVL